MNKTRKFHMPTAYTILLLLVAVMAVLTWVIPAGHYAYTADGQPIAGSYTQVAQNGQGFTAVVRAPLEGFYQAIDIAAFILMVGAFQGVIAKTGAIDAGVQTVVYRLKGREKLLIPLLMIAFALGGTTFGMAEETIAFYPLLVPMLVSAGYDAMTAVSVILLGAGSGVLASTVNPFATGIAAGFADISLGDGIALRVVMWVVLVGLSIWYVMRYASKVSHHPEASLVQDLRSTHTALFTQPGAGQNQAIPFTATHKRILSIFAFTYALMAYAVIPFADLGLPLPTLGWGFLELSALYLTASIVAGLVGRLHEKDLIDGIVAGAADLLGVALIIGISRGISVVMDAGAITDTILRWGEQLLQGAGSVAFLLLSYLLFLPLSVIIPSTSGLATLSMPIFAPLADFAGIGRDLVITAFQSASGLVNLVTPTSAVVMGGLSMGHVPYDRWLRYVWKFLLLLFVATILFLLLGVAF